MKKYTKLSKKIKQNTKKEYKYDFCFVGSDQLLNPLINNFDINYFCPSFISGKKVIYGGSTSNENFVNNVHYKVMVDAFEKCDAISVREESTKQLCEKIKTNLPLVCDPVFLIKKMNGFH